MVKNPLDLGGREIRINHQASLLVDHLLITIFNQLFGDVARLLRLPDNCVINRLTGMAIPNNRRFPLVSNPNRRNLIGLDLGLNHYVWNHWLNAIPNLQGIMFNPPWLREVLRKFLLADRNLISVMVKDNRPWARRSLVNRHDILLFTQLYSSFRC